MNGSFNAFFRLQKVDEEKRLVWGQLAAEVPDRSGEILDYASSKPMFEQWSGDIAKTTNGRSFGNVRAMHSNIAAGKLEALSFDDGAKAINGCAKIVDDQEWAKVTAGVYTGFSIGGAYENRWQDESDPALTRYTARPSEVSLVDLPCIPTATFEMIKADGARETRWFAKEAAMPAHEPTNDEVFAKAQKLAKAAGGLVSDHLEAARAELKKAAVVGQGVEGVEPKPQTVEKAPASPEAPPHAAGVEQVWKARDGTTFAKKADALAHNVRLDDPLEAALARAEAVLEKAEEEPSRADKSAPSGDLAKGDPEKGGEPGQKGPQPKAADPEDGAKAHLAHESAAHALDAAAKLHTDASKAHKAGADDRMDKTAVANAASDHAHEVAKMCKRIDKAWARGELAKWLGEEVWDAGAALQALSTLFSLLSSELAEDEDEAEQQAALREAIQRLKDFIVSEIQEDNDPALAAAAKVHLQKRGAMISASNMKKIQAVHDHCVDMGAKCAGMDGKAAATEDLQKAEREGREALARRIDAITKAHDQKVAALEKRIGELEKSPVPPPQLRAGTRAVGKGDDALDGGSEVAALRAEIDKMAPEERALMMIKYQQRRGQPLAHALINNR